MAVYLVAQKHAQCFNAVFSITNRNMRKLGNFLPSFNLGGKMEQIIRWNDEFEYSLVGSKLFLCKQNSDLLYTFEEDSAVLIIKILSDKKICSRLEFLEVLGESYDIEEKQEKIINFLQALKIEEILDLE